MSLDSETIEAIRVLADAVRRERVTGVIEFRQLERALDAAATEADAEHLEEAAKVFRGIEPEFRDAILKRSHELARIAGEHRRMPGLDAAVDKVLAPIIEPEKAPPTSNASPFLAALNGRPPLRGGRSGR